MKFGCCCFSLHARIYIHVHATGTLSWHTLPCLVVDGETILSSLPYSYLYIYRSCSIFGTLSQKKFKYDELRNGCLLWAMLFHATTTLPLHIQILTEYVQCNHRYPERVSLRLALEETEEILADVMKVEVFRHTIADNVLVGSYCVFSNQGGLVGNETFDWLALQCTRNTISLFRCIQRHPSPTRMSCRLCFKFL